MATLHPRSTTIVAPERPRWLHPRDIAGPRRTRGQLHYNGVVSRGTDFEASSCLPILTATQAEYGALAGMLATC
jgi:hypothetical protein